MNCGSPLREGRPPLQEAPATGHRMTKARPTDPYGRGIRRLPGIPAHTKAAAPFKNAYPLTPIVLT